MSALKQAIAAANDEKVEQVYVPEWDVTLGVRSMTGQDRANLLEKTAEHDGVVSIAAIYPDLIILCAFDPETGESVFEDTPEDRAIILSKNSTALDRVARKAMELSALDEKAEERAGKS